MVHAESSAGAENAISAEDCRAQLSRILNSADFDTSGRKHRFLSHVVEEVLSGRGNRIKAYTVAVEVFGRDVSFDPQLDPIVRIEAGHLRRALERYYLTDGLADPILISIPKGGYVPTFSRRSPETPAPPVEPVVAPPLAPAPVRRVPPLLAVLLVVALAATLAAATWWWTVPAERPVSPELPRLLVESFDDLTGTESSAGLARGMTQEVIGQLSKFKDLVVVESTDWAPGASAPRPRFVLAGSVNLSGDRFRLRTRLIQQSDGSVLWAETYDGGMKVARLLEAQADIARKVATTLAQTYGVIFQADASKQVENAPDDWAAYSCTLSYYAYRVSVDPGARSDVKACLEKAVERFPNYATAWGLLSQIHMDQLRFTYPFDPSGSSAAVERALAIARRAVQLDPYNIRGLQAQMFALYYSRDIQGALEVGRKAMAINPNDTELIGEYGYRLAVSGNWEEGCPLIAQARERNPGPLVYYETGLALCAYFSGDFPQAVAWITRSNAPANGIYHLIAAAVFSEAGHGPEAERERRWLEQNEPGLVANLRREAETRLAKPENVEFFLGSLKKSGFAAAD